MNTYTNDMMWGCGGRLCMISISRSNAARLSAVTLVMVFIVTVCLLLAVCDRFIKARIKQQVPCLAKSSKYNHHPQSQSHHSKSDHIRSHHTYRQLALERHNSAVAVLLLFGMHHLRVDLKHRLANALGLPLATTRSWAGTSTGDQ